MEKSPLGFIVAHGVKSLLLIFMVSTQSNEGAAQMPDASAQADEAAATLDATIRQVCISRQRLRARPTPTQGDQDALLYLETAAMHLRAARCRMAGMMGLASRAHPAI